MAQDFVDNLEKGIEYAVFGGGEGKSENEVDGKWQFNYMPKREIAKLFNFYGLPRKFVFYSGQ